MIMDTEQTRAEATRLLQAIDRGAAADPAELLSVVYGELRAIAASYLSRERVDHTLQPTALVHEAYLKLVDQERVEWQGRAHFLGVAAQAMRRILIDYARTKKRAKRGGQWHRVELEPGALNDEEDSLDLLALDDALIALAELSERQAKVVELRFFGGLSNESVAQALDVSETTVERDWRVARAWLLARLASDEA